MTSRTGTPLDSPWTLASVSNLSHYRIIHKSQNCLENAHSKSKSKSKSKESNKIPEEVWHDIQKG
jgi:hypothetical protein